MSTKSNPQNSTGNRKRTLPEAAKPFQFKPGQSGNPGGRPRTKAVTEAYKSMLAEVDPRDPQGRTYAEIIAGAQIKLASSGDTAAAREVCDRTEGKPRQALDVTAKLEEMESRNEEDVLTCAVTGYWPEQLREMQKDPVAIMRRHRQLLEEFGL